MSCTTHSTGQQNITGNEGTVVAYLPLGEQPICALYYVAQMAMNLKQIKTSSNTQYEHEKHELLQLNERLGVVIDYVRQLESQNAAYIAKLVNFRQQPSIIDVFSAEFNERHVQLRTDLMAINYKKIDYESEYEFFQMRSKMCDQVAHVISEANDKQQLKLKEQLNESSSTLVNLRSSYGQLQNNIEHYRVEHENTFEQYLKVTDEWKRCKKQISELKVTVSALKNQHIFYKNIHSQMSSNSVSTETLEVKDFWTVKWNEIIASIRHDYEILYASVYRELNVYYEKKMEEIQVKFTRIVEEQTKAYQEMTMRTFEISQQRLQQELEELQQLYIQEKKLQKKLETKTSELESEFESMNTQHDETFEKQSKDLHTLQESTITMITSTEEMRQRKISLEGELIVYRHLVECEQMQKEVAMDLTPFVETTTVTTFAIKNHKKEWIGIDCPLDNTYTCLINYSTTREMDVSGWMLKRRIDSKQQLEYTIPNRIQLPPGAELRIYSKLGDDAAQLSSDYVVASSSLHQKLVGNDLLSWDFGNNIETRLFDKNGDEKASYIQTVGSEEVSTR